jgi:hypothetical protein
MKMFHQMGVLPQQQQKTLFPPPFAPLPLCSPSHSRPVIIIINAPSLPNIIRQSVSHQQPQQPFILAEGASFFLSRNSIDFFTPKVENRE